MARASLIEQRLAPPSNNRATRASNTEWELSYRMAVQARKSKKLHHRGVMKLRRWQEQGGLEKCDLWLFGRHVRSGASRLAKQRLGASWQACMHEDPQEQSSRLSMEHPGAAGSGEVKTCRREAVVEAGAEAILNNMGPKQLAYILNRVVRVMRCTLAGVVDGWVMSQLFKS